MVQFLSIIFFSWISSVFLCHLYHMASYRDLSTAGSSHRVSRRLATPASLRDTINETLCRYPYFCSSKFANCVEVQSIMATDGTAIL